MQSQRIVKLQSGLLVGYTSLDAYIINGFYPLMAERFSLIMRWTILVEFDSQRCDWRRFRQEIVGNIIVHKHMNITRAGLHRLFPQARRVVIFLHGSAGPLEGLQSGLYTSRHRDWQPLR